MKQFDDGSCQYVFIDESGDPYMDFEKSGTSDFYIVSSVIVSSTLLKQCREKAEQIRKDFFQKGEIKSSSVGRNLDRRIAILKKISSLPIHFYAFVVSKRDIYQNTGLQFKRSFIKYIHRRLYERICKSWNNIQVIADEHGHREFMESLDRYFLKNIPNTLFGNYDFSFKRSHDEVLIQIADFLAGSLYGFYGKKDTYELLDLIKPFTIMIERWPPTIKSPSLLEGLDVDDQFDDMVANHGIESARNFIANSHSSGDSNVSLQIDTLNYLLYQYELDPSSYVRTHEILSHLNDSSDENIKEQKFRASVIGILRNEGVIIASSNEGYKIPSCQKDMRSFVSLVESTAIPYLKRLAIAREDFRFVSKGEYEIVPSDIHPDLNVCLEAMKKQKHQE